MGAVSQLMRAFREDRLLARAMKNQALCAVWLPSVKKSLHPTSETRCFPRRARGPLRSKDTGVASALPPALCPLLVHGERAPWTRRLAKPEARGDGHSPRQAQDGLLRHTRAGY